MERSRAPRHHPASARLGKAPGEYEMTDYVETAQRVIPRRTFHNGHLSEGLANILREIWSLNRAACAQSFAGHFPRDHS